MEEKFEPIMGLELIQQTIKEAKSRFEENGFVYILWGATIAICALGQFLLEQFNVPYAFMIWLLSLISAGITFIHFYRKEKKIARGKNVISRILSISGMIVGTNIFILGFGFWPYLGQAFTPVITIMLAFYAMIIGIALQFKMMFISAILINLIGFALFFVDIAYHPLGTAIAALCLLLIPGIVLNYRNS